MENCPSCGRRVHRVRTLGWGQHEGSESCRRTAIDYAMAGAGLVYVHNAKRVKLLNEAAVDYQLVQIHYLLRGGRALIERWEVVPHPSWDTSFKRASTVDHAARTATAHRLYVEPWVRTILTAPLKRTRRLILLRKYREDSQLVETFLTCLDTARRGGRELGRAFAQNYFVSYFSRAA